jgi:hypothetical protein
MSSFAPPDLGVGCIAKPIAKQIETKHKYKNGKPWKGWKPPGFRQMLTRFGYSKPPIG